MTRPLRVVFICTQNKLRSPTAEMIFRSVEGWEVTSAGTDRTAEQPLTRDLLEWADVAICMEKRHRDWIRSKLKGALPDNRILTLGIPDEYEFMEPDLIEILSRLVPSRLAQAKPKDEALDLRVTSERDHAWDVALSTCRTLRAKGSTVEDVLLFLRRAGFWKLESIKALRDLEGMTISEAKAAVHLSPVWSDRYEADEAFHDQLESELESFRQEVKSGEGKG